MKWRRRPTIHRIRMAKLTYLFVLLSTVYFDQTVGIEMSLNNNAIQGQPLEILMDIGNITTSVSLTSPGLVTETCLAPLGGVPGFCTGDLSQDLPTAITTFTIASALRSRDQGVWTSTHGTDPQETINITVLTIPTLNVTSQAVSSLTLSNTSPNTEVLRATVNCAYPGVTFDLSFVPKGGGTTVSASSSTSTCTSAGNSGCDTDAYSYTCTITPQYEAGLVAGTTYNIHVTVNLDGQYQPIGLNDTITDTDITVQGTPTTPAPSPCRCGWDWLPCDWECYYFYIIIAAVVVVVVFLLVFGVCCCCRHGYCGDDDAEACVCCMRKRKLCKDSVNLNENENGQKNVPRSSENGRQVNPSESGKENTSESPCHNNPAYFESEGTDM